MARYDFWTHGVNTFVETNDHNLIVERRGDKGTVVRSAEPLESTIEFWLHIPIPTPTCLRNDETIKVKYLAFRGWLENAGHIERFHVRQGGTKIEPTIRIEPDDLRGFPDRLFVDRYIDVHDTEINEGLALCVHVQLQNTLSIIEVLGAGARFDT